jgi:hypothetical protein
MITAGYKWYIVHEMPSRVCSNLFFIWLKAEIHWMSMLHVWLIWKTGPSGLNLPSYVSPLFWGGEDWGLEYRASHMLSMYSYQWAATLSPPLSFLNTKVKTDINSSFLSLCFYFWDGAGRGFPCYIAQAGLELMILLLQALKYLGIIACITVPGWPHSNKLTYLFNIMNETARKKNTVDAAPLRALSSHPQSHTYCDPFRFSKCLSWMVYNSSGYRISRLSPTYQQLVSSQ